MTAKLSYKALEKKVRDLESERIRIETDQKIVKDEIEKYRLITNATSDYIYSGFVGKDGDIQIKWAIGAFTRITGYTVDQVNSLEGTWYSVVLKQDIHKITDGELHLQTDDAPLTSEYRIRTMQGNVKWLQDRVIRSTYCNKKKRLEILGGVRDITDQIVAEKGVRKLYQDLKLRESIAHTFLNAGENDIFSKILSLLLKEFSCRFGYTGYIDDSGDLVCPSMTQGIWSKCRVPEKSVVFAKSHWGGIWGESLKKKCAMFSNSNLLTPKGHVSIKNILVAPMILEDRVVGQFALADKTTDFNVEDERKLQRIADFTAPVLRIYLEKEAAIANQRKQNKKLEARNIALNVLIDNRDEEKKRLGDHVVDNFERLVAPYFEKVRAAQRSEDIETFISIIERNAKESMAPLETSRPQVYRNFTPTEIQIADLIKSNKSSKEISQTLNISLRSVFFHRANLRRKLNINKTGRNLKSSLMRQR